MDMDMDMDMDIIYPVNMGRFVSQGGLTNGLRRLLNACFFVCLKNACGSRPGQMPR